MQVREKSGQILTEPATAAEFKTFSGYSGTDQDSLIASLITAARQLFEDETGLSVISKVYEVEFDRWDMLYNELNDSTYDDGWFRLPFSPVTDIASVEIGGITTTYTQRGLKVVDIHPDQIVATGTTNNTLAVEFTAGLAEARAKNAILRMVSDWFNNREDNVSGLSMASLTFGTRQLISSLSTNTGL